MDANNNAWITNWPNPSSNPPAAGNTVSVFNNSGASVAGSSGYSTGTDTYPNAVAIDTDGSAWVADWGDSELTHLSSSGQELSGSPYSSAQLIDPFAAAAIDKSQRLGQQRGRYDCHPCYSGWKPVHQL